CRGPRHLCGRQPCCLLALRVHPIPRQQQRLSSSMVRLCANRRQGQAAWHTLWRPRTRPAIPAAPLSYYQGTMVSASMVRLPRATSWVAGSYGAVLTALATLTKRLTLCDAVPTMRRIPTCPHNVVTRCPRAVGRSHRTRSMLCTESLV